MKKLLLIMGDLATGKSTFAGILSQRYNVIAFNKDRFKETLGDTIGFSDREGNLRLSAASGALMAMIFEEFGKQGKDLILESNFRQAELENLYNIAETYGYSVLTVCLRGSFHVLHPRFLHRLHHENRHPVHACGGFEDYDTFCAYLTRQRDVKIPGTTIQCTADSFHYQTDQQLLSRLDEFMGFVAN